MPAFLHSSRRMGWPLLLISMGLTAADQAPAQDLAAEGKPAPLVAQDIAGGGKFYPGATPQIQWQHQGHSMVLTLLAADLLHVAYSDAAKPGPIWLSPMVVPQHFAGPAQYHWDSEQKTLSTSALVLQLEDGACLRVSEVASPQPRLLTRWCVQNWGKSSLDLTWSAEQNREVLGLGQQLLTSKKVASWQGGVRQTGHVLGNAMTYGDIQASGNTQVPVAYVLGEGLQNYGVYFDTPYALQFDFSKAQWKVNSNQNALSLFMFTGQNLPALRHRYLDLTGRPPVPPLKAFGLWISEYGYDSWRELDGKITSMQKQGLPLDGAVLDLQWFGGIEPSSESTSMGKFTWDTTMFPKPAEKLKGYAEQGLGIITLEESYVGSALPEHQALQEHQALVLDCAQPCTKPTFLDNNTWWGAGGMIDWTHSQGAAWWHDQKRVAIINDGVLGHWTDLGEPEIYNPTSYYHGYDWYGQKAVQHRDVHNIYNFFWSQSIAESTARTHPQRRPWILSRSGAQGSQRWGVAMWSGDVLASFSALSAQMVAQTNMSLSGFDYYGSDVGGFRREFSGGKGFDTLYSHWLATSALLDVPLRPHVLNLCNCNETAPSLVGEAESNAATLALRYQLAPYFYSLAHAAYADGEPVFPPLVYHFQSDLQARAISTTKMLGPWLLFGTPSSDNAQVSVYLPQGPWVNYHHPEQVENSAGQSIKRAVRDNNIIRAPLFMRAGAIVPTLAETPKNLGSPRASGVHWFSPLLVRAVPAASASQFTLVEDDGLTRAYQNGKWARTLLRVSQTDKGLVQVQVQPNNQTGETGQRQLSLDLLTGKTAFASVKLNGQTLAKGKVGQSEPGWWPQNGGVRVQLGLVSVDAPQKLELQPE